MAKRVYESRRVRPETRSVRRQGARERPKEKGAITEATMQNMIDYPDNQPVTNGSTSPTEGDVTDSPD
ncbi:uncharacterized protein LAESUDRAFT_137962 [Laetiporus sulphureus 93-53]|uniref:Uncharacterized protein n=1 Tax=Laetiporus sulphureus 93-53 TaxID=1314785 RepID=A0A165EDH2_9APHY|nr:uncharacterized protein LAESUDRAFT_137962 [Laetiporus sulphureus 93-53]KZT06802.1 hypothetical protein LAESUDRAFT_137962 [Laetiporus sulphureus 93-53]